MQIPSLTEKEGEATSGGDHEDICSWRVKEDCWISCRNILWRRAGTTTRCPFPRGMCVHAELPPLPRRSPLLSMSSAITEASRASPSITGQMGWSFPEMVKPAAVILLLNLVKGAAG